MTLPEKPRGSAIPDRVWELLHRTSETEDTSMQAMRTPERRISDLESWAFQTGTDLIEIKTAIAALPETIKRETREYLAPMFEQILDTMATKADVANLTGEVHTIRTDLTNLTGEVHTIRTDLTNLTGEVHTIRTDLTNLTGEVHTLRSEVADLGAEMQKVNQRLDVIIAALVEKT